MQELLSLVVEAAIFAVPALFIANMVVKIHDSELPDVAIPDEEIAGPSLPDVGISDEDLLGALPPLPAPAPAPKAAPKRRVAPDAKAKLRLA